MTPRLPRFLWSWFLFCLLFFSVSGGKANYYMITGMPALVMLLALQLHAPHRGQKPHRPIAGQPVPAGDQPIALASSAIACHDGQRGAISHLRGGVRRPSSSVWKYMPPPPSRTMLVYSPPLDRPVAGHAYPAALAAAAFGASSIARATALHKEAGRRFPQCTSCRKRRGASIRNSRNYRRWRFIWKNRWSSSIANRATCSTARRMSPRRCGPFS